MKVHFVQRGLWATILGMGLLTSLSQAQSTIINPPMGSYYPEGAPRPELGPPGKRTSIDYPLAAQSPRVSERASYYWRAREKPRVGCYTTFNDYSCSSVQSECDFIFGSCRIFFGERCLKGPPPDPIAVYRYHQPLYIRGGDHTIPNRGQIPVFGTTPETMPPPEEWREGYANRKARQASNLAGYSQGCDCDQ